MKDRLKEYPYIEPKINIYKILIKEEEDKEKNKDYKKINNLKKRIKKLNNEKNIIEEYLKILNEIERKIVNQYYFEKENKTLFQIAMNLNFSESYIKKIHSRLLKKIQI